MQVTIVGYGAVGRETAKLLLERGDTVRVAQRKRPGTLPEAAEFVATDVLDRNSVQRACAGSDAVICCIGFPYDSRVWEKAWPKAMDNMLAACAKAQARFVFADNLYMYGPQDRPLTEDMPLTEFGRKPKVRAGITRAWQQAHADGRVQAVAVRGSDFYGPDVENSVLSNYGVKRLRAGQARAHSLFAGPPPRLHLRARLRTRTRDPAGCASGCLWPSLACAERAHANAAFAHCKGGGNGWRCPAPYCHAAGDAASCGAVRPAGLRADRNGLSNR